MAVSYKFPLSQEHLGQLRTQHAGIIAEPPAEDTLISVVYRDIQDGKPAVTGALVVAGRHTRDLHPLTRLDPLHFVKVYHPGARTNTQREFDLSQRAYTLARPKLFPKPLGAALESRSPFGPKDNQQLQMGQAETFNLYRSRAIAGATLSVVSPLPKGHYLPDTIDPAALEGANLLPMEELKRFWEGLEKANRVLKGLHKAGVCHGDGHRHNILLVNQGGSYEACYIDFEAARFREDLTPAEWTQRTRDDFDDLHREAIFLQQTKLGPQPTVFARAALARQSELLQTPSPMGPDR